jgi:hypothetical protein
MTKKAEIIRGWIMIFILSCISAACIYNVEIIGWLGR